MVEAHPRACGTCTACCKTFEISSELVTKKHNEWCQFCAIGKGCQVYELRPAPCVSYRCRWLTGSGDDDDRPDRRHIIIDDMRDTDRALTMMRFSELRPGALKSAFAVREMAAALAAGLAVYRYPVQGRHSILIRKGSNLPEAVRALHLGGIEVFEAPVHVSYKTAL